MKYCIILCRQVNPDTCVELCSSWDITLFNEEPQKSSLGGDWHVCQNYNILLYHEFEYKNV